MAEWQPIDTAPRDGTRILASDYNVVTIVTWNNFGWRGWINGKGWSMSPPGGSHCQIIRRCRRPNDGQR